MKTNDKKCVIAVENVVECPVYGVRVNEADLSLSEKIQYLNLGEKLAEGSWVDLGDREAAVGHLMAVIVAQDDLIRQMSLKIESRGNPYRNKKTQGIELLKPRLGGF